MAKISQKVLKNNSNNIDQEKKKKVKRTRKTVPRDSPQPRSSIFRGVTRHRWTGRYEAHLWDKNSWNESQNKKGRQVYLGAYEEEEAAAHAYDLAALKYWGQHTILNFQVSTYEKEVKEMEDQSKEEYIGSLRRKSSGFSRGVSKYRGVARHHHNGRWEARIGRVFGNKYLYLGTYATQEEAAIAYDMAAVEYRGLNAVTNFDLSRYIKWLRPENQNDTNSSFVAKEEATTSSPPTTSNSVGSTSSALGLLLQSSKFKEMIEKSSSFKDDQEISPECDSRQSSFPEDIQTVFDCLNSDNYTEGTDNIFGDLNSFATHIFHN